MVFRLIHTIENSRDTDVTQQPTRKQFNRPDERYRDAPDKLSGLRGLTDSKTLANPRTHWTAPSLDSFPQSPTATI